MTNSLSAGKELEKPSIPSELSVADVLSSICDEKALDFQSCRNFRKPLQ
jgi:hypothetical protein